MTRPTPRLTPVNLLAVVLLLAVLALVMLDKPYAAILLLLAALAVGGLGAMRLLKRQRQQCRLAESTLEAMADAVVRFDKTGRIAYLNRAASELIGLGPDKAGRCGIDEAFQLLQQDGRRPLLPMLCEEARRGHVTDLGIDAILVTNEKLEVRVEGQCAPLKDAHGEPAGGILVMRDVTEIRELQRREAWLAEHDALTGTLNRKALENRLARSIHGKRASEYPMSLLYVEVANHKPIHEAVGRAAANELLVQAARIIQARIRDSDPIGRHGETTFAVLLTACPPEAAERIARTVHDNLSHHIFQWGRFEEAVAAHLGIVHIQPNWETLDHALAAAQAACALSAARGGVAVYHE